VQRQGERVGPESPGRRAGEAAAPPERVAGLIPTRLALAGADAAPPGGHEAMPDHDEAMPDEIGGESARPALDLEWLEETSMGQPSLRESLLSIFLTDVRPRLEQLSLAVSGHDPDRIEFEAHGLKGMCLTLGAMTCAGVFAELERMGRERKLDAAPSALKRAYLEVTRTERFITAMERRAA